jgi:hypothetical protein
MISRARPRPRPAIRRLAALAASLILVPALLSVLSGPGDRPAAGPAPDARPSIAAAYGGLPLHFEPNRGQAPDGVDFLARGDGYALLLSPGAAALSLRRPAPAPDPGPDAAPGPAAVTAPAAPTVDGPVVRLEVLGAAGRAPAVPEDALPGRVNYFLGNDPARWRTDIPTYGRVRYPAVYPGVDLVYYGHGRQLEYDFVPAPGADPGLVRLRLGAVERAAIDAAGDLVLGTTGGTIRQRRPLMYQERGGLRETVDGGYLLGSDPPSTDARSVTPESVGGAGDPARTASAAPSTGPSVEVGSWVGAYDAGRPLVIDPVLVYSTYLGGSGGDSGSGIAVDGQGSAYVTGFTESPDFPLANPLPPPNTTLRGGGDAFVAKLGPGGNTLVYSTYLGGSSGDVGFGIAVDAQGNAYVTGSTRSVDLLASPLPPNNALRGGDDAFVAKLGPGGNTLVYSTYLGGSGPDVGSGIAVDAQGSAYVAGITNSADFPLVNPLPPPNNALRGVNDAFVTRLSERPGEPPPVIPELSTVLMFGSGLAGLGGYALARMRRRRRR